jgi:hypothetical protein
MKKKVEPTLAQHLTGVLVKSSKNESWQIDTFHNQILTFLKKLFDNKNLRCIVFNIRTFVSSYSQLSKKLVSKVVILDK